MEQTEALGRIEKTLLENLPACADALSFIPEILTYSLESGGKRIRPLLCLAFCEACGGDPERALLFAAAVEYVHTYSLIHDDLPCMDDDDFRRGKPSSHKRFGEANAVLAGDALLTHAFALLARAAQTGAVGAGAAVRAASVLSLRAGADGMVGGQYLDLAYEGKNAPEAALFTMDALKTGALMQAACALGCIAADASAEKIAAAEDYALYLGLAFQLKDDLLEYESGEETSDEENGKSTYVSVLGAEKTRSLAAEYTARAQESLTVFGGAAAPLYALAEKLLHRDH